MNTNITTLPTDRRSQPVEHPSTDMFRQPAYDCEEFPGSMKLVVYLPGVNASGVEIEGRGADITITAKKAQFVRVNFEALHLENVQRDYRLRLRLGSQFDFAAMAAEIVRGVLTITLPKRARIVHRAALRQVA